MKKYVNGEYIDMTVEEIAEIEALAAEQPAPEPTAEERSATLIAPVGFLRPHITACLYPMLVPDVC